MACKGICHRFKGKPRYDNTKDNKKCSICDTFVKWKGSHCPCCNQMLSLRPNKSKYRKSLRERLGIKEVTWRSKIGKFGEICQEMVKFVGF